MTEWQPCKQCCATVRHDDGICTRDPRHPRFVRGWGIAHDESDPRIDAMRRLCKIEGIR